MILVPQVAVKIYSIFRKVEHENILQNAYNTVMSCDQAVKLRHSSREQKVPSSIPRLVIIVEVTSCC